MIGVEAPRRGAVKAACTEIITNGKQFLFLVHRFATQTWLGTGTEAMILRFYDFGCRRFFLPERLVGQ